MVESGGTGTGGSGTSSENGDAKVWRQIGISDVRVVPIGEHEGVYRVSFTPKEKAVIKLQFKRAGDNHAYEPRKTLQTASISKKGKLKRASIPTFKVKALKRFFIDIYDPSPVPNAAWIVSAAEEIKKSK